MSKKRSFSKAVTWRIVASTDTFIVSYFFTGDVLAAGSIASIEVATKMALYYYHDRAWEVNWRFVGRKVLDKILQPG